MMLPFGALSHVGFGRETKWGVAASVTDYFRFVSESLTEEIEQLISGVAPGIDEGTSYEGSHTLTGDVVIETFPDVMGFLLGAAFGTPVTTRLDPVSNPTVYQHIFTPSKQSFSQDCALPPYTLEIHRDLEQAFRYSGCAVNELVFSFGTDNKIMTATASMIAKSVSLIAPTTPTYESTAPFLWHQASILIDGETISDIQTLDFGVNNSLEGRSTLNGTKEISRIKYAGNRSFPINLTLDLTDLTEFERFRSQSEVAVQIALTGEVISGAYRFKIMIDIPKFRYNTFPITLSGAETVTAQVNSTAKYDASSLNAIQITLINTMPSYSQFDFLTPAQILEV
jgi:hypothetical protein